MQRTLQEAIWRNKRRAKYRSMLRRLRLNWFQYVDQGKGPQAHRLIEKCLAIIADRQ